MESLALRWTGVVRQHPGRILAGALVLTLVLAGGLTRLRFDSSEATMIPSGSTVYTDNVRYQRQFGGDPMVVVFSGANRDLLAGRNLAQLRGLQHQIGRASCRERV